MIGMLLALTPVIGQTGDNPLVAEVARCLTLADDAARLACHDAAARRLVEAERARELVVVDKDQVRRTRRSLFGLDLGSTDPITGRNEPSARIETLDTSIQSYRPGQAGRWLMTLAEGGRWQTTEGWSGGSEPRRGAKVTLRRGALGSYILKMDGARAVRVQRVN